MRTSVVMVLIGLCTALAFGGEVSVQKVQGEVAVRNGVTEAWVPLKAGVSLSPGATVRTGPTAAAVLVTTAGGVRKSMTLPAEVMLDLEDIRDLTREELMLKLTMQKVRSSPYQWKGGAPAPSGTTVVHGTNTAAAGVLGENDPAVGEQMLNGARVLFENGFYSTSALRAMEVFRAHPALSARFRERWMVAEALERADLKGEAVSEFSALGREEFLTDAERDQVSAKLEKLKRNQ